jgi:hypothetical protein
MSTLAGKPFDQTNPPFPSRQSDEQPSADSQPDGADPCPSAYAPKRLRVVPSTPLETSTNELGTAPRFLTKDNKPREPRAEPRLVVEPVDGPMRLHSLQAASERPPSETDAASQEKDDLERLEASLRWLKDQTVRSSKPALRKPLVSAHARLAATHGQRHSSALAEAKVREPKPLEPESLLAPALRRAQYDSGDSRRWILVACIIAAPLAILGVTMLPHMEMPGDVNVASAVSNAVRVPRQPVLPAESQVDDLALSSAPRMPAVRRGSEPVLTPALAVTGDPPARPSVAPVPVPPPVADTTVAVLPPRVAPEPPAPPPPPRVAPAPQAPPPPSAPALRQMDPAEVRILVQQGEQFMAVGDVVAARMVFQRAAETGDAGAAMALGATYDPFILARLGTLGMVSDVAKARHWYQKAKEFGSQEAPRRLELLANR